MFDLMETWGSDTWSLTQVHETWIWNSMKSLDSKMPLCFLLLWLSHNWAWTGCGLIISWLFPCTYLQENEDILSNSSYEGFVARDHYALCLSPRPFTSLGPGRSGGKFLLVWLPSSQLIRLPCQVYHILRCGVPFIICVRKIWCISTLSFGTYMTNGSFWLVGVKRHNLCSLEVYFLFEMRA